MPRVKLTAGRIEGFTCEPNKAQSFLWHSAVHQLALRVTPAGAKAFVFQSTLKGKTIRTTIGSPKTWSIEAAEAEARRLQMIIDSGRDPREVKKQAAEDAEAAAVAKREATRAKAAEEERNALTLGEVWKAYIVDRTSSWGERHLADHLEIIRNGGEPRSRSKQQFTEPGVLASLAGVRLVDLTPDRLKAWLDIEMGKRPTRARLAFRLLKACLNWCLEHRLYKHVIQSNPTDNKVLRRTLGEPGVKRDCLLREQLAAWFNAVRNLENPVVSAYLQTLLLTGARPGEVLVMKWDDVKLRWNSLTIRDKVEGEREIPLTPYVASLLKLLPRRSPPHEKFVFSSNKSDHLTSPHYQLRSVCRIAEIEHLTLHGLRRSYKTLSDWLDFPTGVVALNRHGFSRHSQAVGNTAFHIRPATSHC